MSRARRRGRTRPGLAWLEVGIAALAAGGIACAPPSASSAPVGSPRAAADSTDPTPAAAIPAITVLTLQIVAVYPHDTSAFTQGLLWDRGHLYESTGLEGASTLREVELASGRVLRRAELPPAWFGEGLARVGDELVQLTWRDGVALRWDRARFERLGEWRYAGEGWGLASDGHELVMSDGSSWLTFRDPTSFAALRRVQVVDERGPLGYVNELEWADGALWANIWQSDAIVRIDPASGRVTARADAVGLLAPEEREAADVLNGLAWDPEKRLFYVTGKLWPKLFAVRFEPAR